MIFNVKIPADLSHTGQAYFKNIDIDDGVVDIVQALQDAGIDMRGSCDGHGQREGNIHLQDGRMLLVLNPNQTDTYLALSRCDSPPVFDVWLDHIVATQEPFSLVP